MHKIESIEINLGESKTRTELSDALRILANDIENGYYSGIIGWSDISWKVGLSEDKEDES